MKYPKLVRNPKTDFIITLFDGLDRFGNKKEILQKILKVNIGTTENKAVLKNGTYEVSSKTIALIDGDLAPTIEGFVDGEATVYHGVNSKNYKVLSIAKERNPDGTVNYTRVELI